MSFTVVNDGKINEWLLKFGYNINGFPNLCRDLITELLIEGPQQRSELVARFNKPRTTIYEHLIKLMNMGWVEKYNKHTGKSGRPRVFFEAVITAKGDLKYD